MAIGAPYILTDMDVQQGIEALSMRLLGDASLWPEIVQLNQLIPPYMTMDPIAAYGLPLDKQVLTAAVSAGATQTALTANVQLWVAGNTVVFVASGVSGLISEVQTIASYDGQTLTWGAGLQNSYPIGTQVLTYPVSVTQGKILMPGQIIYLPVTAQTQSFVLSLDAMLSDVLGSDAAAPLTWANGDIATVQGPVTLGQRLRAVLLTWLQTLPQAPGFGSQLNRLIGMGTNTVEWTAYARQAILTLPEVSQVTDMSVTANGDQVNISAKVWIATSSTPLLLNESLTLPILQ